MHAACLDTLAPLALDMIGWGGTLQPGKRCTIDAPMPSRLKKWLGRGALVLLGCVAALALVEVALRAAGRIYRSRQEAVSGVTLEHDGTIRILCLGESTTAGLGQGKEAYPNQLERILNARAAGEAAFRVINGGVIATTSDVILARLPEHLDKLNPHIVVAMMGINDGHLIDPGFQVGGRLRVWKLAKMLYHTWRDQDREEAPERLVERAGFVLRASPEVAAGLADRAARLRPEDPRPWLILAEAKARLGESQSARQLYDKVLAMEPAAVLARSIEAIDLASAPLAAALEQFPEDANALAARALLATRERHSAAALDLARQATRADPSNVVAMIIEGGALLAAQRPADARGRYQQAIHADPLLARVLAASPATGTPLLSTLVEANSKPATEFHPDHPRRWFIRPAEDMAAGFIGLRLLAASENAAKGDVEQATRDLEELAATFDPLRANLRLSAVGQLAVLEWQAGNRQGAESYHQEIEDFLEIVDNPVTRKNYREILAMLRGRGIPLVAVQYPMRRVEPLERLLELPSDVVFVDNEEAFKSALLGRPATEIFTDLFAGDFGHLTPLGNRILAENVADAITSIVGVRSKSSVPARDQSPTADIGAAAAASTGGSPGSAAAAAARDRAR